MVATKEQRALLSTRGAENPLLLKHEVMRSAIESSGKCLPFGEHQEITYYCSSFTLSHKGDAFKFQ